MSTSDPMRGAQNAELTLEQIQEFQECLAESMRWSTLHVSLDEISEESSDLVADLAEFNRLQAISMLAALATLPAYQSNAVRLDVLIALAVLHCAGEKPVRCEDLARWFSSAGDCKWARGEDRAEDVFVARISDGERDYLLLEGTWESAGFYTQRFVDLLVSMPDENLLGQVKRSAFSLLKLCDALCVRAGLARYESGSSDHPDTLDLATLPAVAALSRRMRFNPDDLQRLGIERSDLDVFFFDPDWRTPLATQQVGFSALDRHPLIHTTDGSVIVVLPGALSVALRDFVIETVVEAKIDEMFDVHLAQAYSKLFFDTPLLGGPTGAPVIWHEADGYRIGRCAIEVDSGFFFSFHFLLPPITVHAPRGFKDPHEPPLPLDERIAASFAEAISDVSATKAFKAGQLILVLCGWGKGIKLSAPRPSDPRWRMDYVSASDLVRLSALADMKPKFYWRLQEGVAAAQRAGLILRNINGLANLIGWVEANDGHLIPHERLPKGRVTPENPLLVQPPLDLLREVRQVADQGLDTHVLQDSSGRAHELQRPSAKPLFPTDSLMRLYGSRTRLREGKPTSVYEGRHRFWVTLEAPSLDTGTLKSLWEMSNEWLHRIGAVLDSECTAAEPGNFELTALFEDEQQVNSPTRKPNARSLGALCEITREPSSGRHTVVFRAGFLDGFRLAENLAERWVVRSYLRAFTSLLGNPEERLASLEAVIVPNDEARSFHIMPAHNFLDFVRDTLPSPSIGVNSIDDAAQRLGIGWRALPADHPGKILGKANCVSYLNQTVALLADDLVAELAQYNRRSTLAALLANHECAKAEGDTWRRTSAAVIGLHGDNALTRARFVEQQSRLASASVTSRNLIEVALCCCPVAGGTQLSRLELSKLVAKNMILVRLGGVSDAIYYSALTPEIQVSALGDILFRSDFGDLVVEPLLTDALGERYVAAGPQQRANYGEPVVVPETKNRIDPEFQRIWNAEMGFEFDEGRRIIDALEDRGIEERTAVLALPRSAFFDLMKDRNIPEIASRSFFDRFSLVTRSSWLKPPRGFGFKDIQPWRLGRRLSTLSRPILMIDSEADPELMIAPHLLRNSFGHLVSGAFHGTYGQEFFHTPKMRDEWWGKAREGHSFNAKVAAALIDRGWNVRENIAPTEILRTKAERNFGDVDVLAWRAGHAALLVIESKDLSFARTYSEIAALLSDFQGGYKNNSPDKLRLHLDRVALLKANPDALARFTGLPSPNVESWLVFSGLMPMQYAKIPALEGSRLGRLEDLLAFTRENATGDTG